MTVLDVLGEARRLVAAGWTQDAAARGRDGRRCGCRDEEAVSFCAYGALARAGGPGGSPYTNEPFWRALLLLEKVIGGYSLAQWNDRSERTREDVLAAYDLAIAIEEAERRRLTGP